VTEHGALMDELTRRGLLRRGGLLGPAALLASAGPVARTRVEARPAHAEPALADGTLQGFADTAPAIASGRAELGLA
jgi:hypothetical protein